MGTTLATIEGKKAIDIFSCDMAETIISGIEKEARSIVPDTRTQKGRDEIASIAYKVAQSKVALDNLGKNLVGDWKTKAKAVDVERKLIRDRLDALKAEIRQPLTDYEEAESARIKAAWEAAELLDAHIEALQENELFDREREIARKEAEQAKKEQEQLEKEEAEKAEAERVDHERKIAEEAAKQAKRKAEAQARAKEAEAEEERLKAVKQQMQAEEAVKQAQRDQIAAEERAKVQAENAERQVKEAAEQAKQIEIERQAEEKRKLEAEQAERDANRQHVSRVRGKAKEALMKYVDEETAKKIVMAITNDQIPNVTINY